MGRRRWWVGVSGGGGSAGRGRCGLCALTPAIITYIVRPPQGATGRWRGTRRVPQRSHGPLLLVIPCQLRLSKIGRASCRERGKVSAAGGALMTEDRGR